MNVSLAIIKSHPVTGHHGSGTVRHTVGIWYGPAGAGPPKYEVEVTEIENGVFSYRAATAAIDANERDLERRDLVKVALRKFLEERGH